MAQKEWKREEMKQNQGRTEQNQRKKVQKKTGYRAVLAASMFLIVASAALSACKKSPAAETTAQTQAAEETEGAVSTALGAADRVLEAKRREAAERNALARRLLDGFPLETRTTGFFCWLKLPDPWAAVAFAEAARQRGIIVADSDLFALNRAAPEQGVRLALGGVRTREALADALGTLAGMLHG